MALLIPVVVHADNPRNAPLDKAMNEIRLWLDSERIQPVAFRMVVNGAVLGFEISFQHEHDAARFEEQFASLLA